MINVFSVEEKGLECTQVHPVLVTIGRGQLRDAGVAWCGHDLQRGNSSPNRVTSVITLELNEKERSRSRRIHE